MPSLPKLLKIERVLRIMGPGLGFACLLAEALGPSPCLSLGFGVTSSQPECRNCEAHGSQLGKNSEGAEDQEEG